MPCIWPNTMAETASNTKKTDKTECQCCLRASTTPPGSAQFQHPSCISLLCVVRQTMTLTPNASPRTTNTRQTNALSVLRYGKMLVIPLWKHCSARSLTSTDQVGRPLHTTCAKQFARDLPAICLPYNEPAPQSRFKHLFFIGLIYEQRQQK